MYTSFNLSNNNSLINFLKSNICLPFKKRINMKNITVEYSTKLRHLVRSFETEEYK